MTEHEIFVCVKAKYGAEFAMIPQVRNTTGFGSAKIRTADALAVSLWPSRGIGIEGFEFKDSRTDWLKELKEPAKAEEISRFCYAWWVVTSAREIIAPGELPPTWGHLLAVNGTAKVVTKPKQPLPTPIVPTWAFIASVLRSAASVVVSEDDILKRIKKAEVESYKRGYDDRERSANYTIKQSLKDFEDLKSGLRKFEERSGVKLTDWNWHLTYDIQRIGAAVKMVLDGGARDALPFAINRLESTLATMKQAQAEIEGTVPAPDKPSTDED